MKQYVCDACHYLFQAEAVPEECSICQAKVLMVKTNNGKLIPFSAVREIEAFESDVYPNAIKENDSAGLTERIDSLSKYELNDDEYNLALMLLYRYREWNGDFIKIKFENILTRENSFFNAKAAQTEARYVYEDAVDYFKESIAKERRVTGENNILKVAEKADENSAARVLMLFRREKPKVPTLTNIRAVDVKQAVTNPSKEFTLFLLDWYNGN